MSCQDISTPIKTRSNKKKQQFTKFVSYLVCNHIKPSTWIIMIYRYSPEWNHHPSWQIDPSPIQRIIMLSHWSPNDAPSTCRPFPWAASTAPAERLQCSRHGWASATRRYGGGRNPGRRRRKWPRSTNLGAADRWLFLYYNYIILD